MSRGSPLTERLAMQLRWMEYADAALVCGNKATLSARENWDRASEVLKDGYRKDARYILRFLNRADPGGTAHDSEET